MFGLWGPTIPTAPLKGPGDFAFTCTQSLTNYRTFTAGVPGNRPPNAAKFFMLYIQKKDTRLTKRRNREHKTEINRGQTALWRWLVVLFVSWVWKGALGSPAGASAGGLKSASSVFEMKHCSQNEALPTVLRIFQPLACKQKPTCRF